MSDESELRAERPESDVEQPVTVPAQGLRPWQKHGPSPNPGGRPRSVARVQDYAAANTEKAVDVLVEIMTDPKSSRRTKIVAVNAILDRAYGRPPQTLLTPDRPPVWEQPVDTLEVARRIAFILEHAKRQLAAQAESSTDVRTIGDAGVADMPPLEHAAVPRQEETGQQ